MMAPWLGRGGRHRGPCRAAGIGALARPVTRLMPGETAGGAPGDPPGWPTLSAAGATDPRRVGGRCIPLGGEWGARRAGINATTSAGWVSRTRGAVTAPSGELERLRPAARHDVPSEGSSRRSS
jgi:hypothetical protein